LAISAGTAVAAPPPPQAQGAPPAQAQTPPQSQAPTSPPSQASTTPSSQGSTNSQAPTSPPAQSQTPSQGPLSLIPRALLDAARGNPKQLFHVIVQGDSSDGVANQVAKAQGNNPQAGTLLQRKFGVIDGASVTVSGSQLVALAAAPGVTAITPDEQLHSTAYRNAEMWRQSVDASALWSQSQAAPPAPPTIAIVDSGIDTSKTADFGARVVASVNVSSLTPTATGDDEGHGTMVAGVAAGAATGYTGVAPTARLVAVRTSDDQGCSLTSDILAGLDWILQNKDKYGIRVVNLSMVGDTRTSFVTDPLNKAVEKLWFKGVVVVVAAGNSGTGLGEVDMSEAPANDPFVITVGALDQNETADPSDDQVPSWSSYGHTADGFAKPDISAPGRYLIVPAPMTSTLVNRFPERTVAPGYAWTSGTSFAAPIVAGAAAQLLARHPDWTPDQVKGALMLTARSLPQLGIAGGVGMVDAAAAAALTSPPSANADVGRYVVTNPLTGEKSFDGTSWQGAVTSGAFSTSAYTTASWTSASWTSASWTSASWTSASWTSASATTASWTSSSQTAAAGIE
jgi:serine protease AprX